MKIVFFCIPAHGHTNPTLGVVRELTARGHAVTYYSYEMLRGKIEAAGARFAPCDAFDPQIGLTEQDVARIGKDLAFSTKLITDMTLALDDAVTEEMLRLQPDVIVGDSMAFWAKLIARKLKIPFVSSTTTFAFNRESAKVIPQSGGSLWAFLSALPKINRSLKPLREKGYAVSGVLDIIQNDAETDTIVYTSPEFQPCAQSFGENFAFVGPIVRPVEQAFAAVELPTVYISLGTVDNQHGDFYRTCLKSFADAPYRVILSVGEKTDIAALGAIPENIQVFPQVDQMAVLAVCDAFVTHCGMNSVSEALYYGVPLVLCPRSPEQKGVANRVAALGAGVLAESDDGIRAAVDAVLASDTLRAGAKAIGESFHRCGGAKAAADKIEAVAQAPVRIPVKKPPISKYQIAQAVVGTIALVLLVIAIFAKGRTRLDLLLLGGILGTGSNVFRFLDKRK